MTIQKGKTYKAKENILGFSKEVTVVSIDKKHVHLRGTDGEKMHLLHETFKECFEEIKNDMRSV